MKMKKKSMLALDLKQTRIAGYVGMMLSVLTTLCFKYASAEVELNSFIFNV
jgi:hypothetical protein